MDQERKPGPVNRRRRRLIAATSAVGAIEIAAAAVPFVGSLLPSSRAKAAGAPVRVSVSGLEPGQMTTVSWREKPVWILHRTAAELHKVEHSKLDLSDPKSQVPQQPPDMDLHLDNGVRALRPQYLVLVGICTHLGCIPEYRPQPGSVGPEWTGGFYCPCHGSKYDLSGRVLAGSPAPINLPVPPYYFESPGVIRIGELKDGADLNWEPKGW
ncbi:MAG: ubiquinol-cytochrome c reductase iron-sulfur subunit [Burkholderiales bacterium]